MSKHELTQILYDELDRQDRYHLDVASSGTFMSKFKGDAIELIKTVAKNSSQHGEKLFGQGATPKGQLIDTKSMEMGMLLERIKNMVEVQNLLLDRLNILNSFEGLTLVSLQDAAPCVHCSRLDHVEPDCR